jgi:L-galactose dehydrogenase/L-glyceraldehyde 3-phosphate reductase
MEYRTLGRTGIRVSAVAFGAGPVSGWMDELGADEQCVVIRRALDVGINWFDTAAGYGSGQSEASLGRALARLGIPEGAHVATKVRYSADRLDAILRCTRESVEGSLRRLGMSRVTLLQLHNSITARRGDEPASITPEDILGPGGVLEAFRALRADGLVGHLGLTGIGQPDAMRQAVRSGAFDTMQVPYNLLNPSAGHSVPAGYPQTDYGNIIADCAAQGMGVFAIRVYAGGALADRPPSAHTHRTPFFPLALYESDRRRAARAATLLGPGRDVKADALRFVLDHPQVSAAIVGCREPGEIADAARGTESGPLPPRLHAALIREAGRS